ncbi:hypothetical protein KAJ61_02270 [Candidatus Parcubacteria bacterium]|nr:hypothetical protein [Candidatus Parcubacteria bacterium]
MMEAMIEAMKNKIEILIMHDRPGDAIALAKKTKITTLSNNFVKNVLYNPKTKFGCWGLNFNTKMRLSKIFGFDIPDDILQMEYAELLDAPNRYWSGCIPATLDLIKKTGKLPSKKLAKARYEQEMLNIYQSGSEIKNMLELCKVTDVPIKIDQNIVQEIFKHIIEFGKIGRLERKEKLLGQKWNPDKFDWDVNAIVQEGYVSACKDTYYDINNLIEFKKRVGIKPTKKILLKLYASIIRYSLKNTKHHGSLDGAERVIRFVEHYNPKQFPEDALKIVENIFLNYRPPELFFDYLTFQRCFPNFKLTKNSELRKKIEEKCEEITKKEKNIRDTIWYLHTVKKCLGFTPQISPEFLSRMREILEEDDRYQLLEELDDIFSK